VAVGQRQRLYSDVRMFTWFYLGSINASRSYWDKGVGLGLGSFNAVGHQNAHAMGEGGDGGRREPRRGGRENAPGTSSMVLTLAVDVPPPRHSARPFHHTRSSIACLHPLRSPITQAPAALPPAVRATSFARSPVPSSLLLSSSPAPPSAALA
jgi:hypothetical protein